VQRRRVGWSRMGSRRSSVLLLRRSVPLVLAVGALLCPASGLAGAPGPDPPASSGGPAPDRAPTARRQTAHVAAVRSPVTAVPVRSASAVVARPRSAPVAVLRQAASRPPAARPARKHVKRAAAPIVDVPALQVDVHRGLGAAARSLRDDSAVLLAGIALLVAASAAASAAALAFVGTRARETTP
jgi:hypothetical protein